MKPICFTLIAILLSAVTTRPVQAVTVDELGSGPFEPVLIQVAGVGIIPVEAGIIKLNVGGQALDGLCIDPFHFSDGVMPGYQFVDLTSAPKGNFMSPATALDIERLWGTYYSPSMSAADAAGLQIAVWELTGGSGFSLHSNNDYGAAGFLATVEAPDYAGPVADLGGLTGPGQDYGALRQSLELVPQSVPETTQTASLLGLAVILLCAAHWQTNRLSPVRVARPCRIRRRRSQGSW